VCCLRSKFTYYQYPKHTDEITKEFSHGRSRFFPRTSFSAARSSIDPAKGFISRRFSSSSVLSLGASDTRPCRRTAPFIDRRSARCCRAGGNPLPSGFQLPVAQHANDLRLVASALLHRPSLGDGLSLKTRDREGGRSRSNLIPADVDIGRAQIIPLKRETIQRDTPRSRRLQEPRPSPNPAAFCLKCSDDGQLRVRASSARQPRQSG
jgi:hypothetical protein